MTTVAVHPRKIGIDVGGVIQGGRGPAAQGVDTFFRKEREVWINTPPIEGAVETISDIVRRRFGPNNSYIVSKCGKPTQKKTLEWFEHIAFYGRTSIPQSHVRFCVQREEKAPICQDLGITDFIDDRLEVLSYMIGIVPNLYLFNPDPEEVRKNERYLPEVVQVTDWAQLRGMLLR